MAQKQQPAAPPPPQLPSPTIRGVVTYLLFVHFFFLAVGIKANTTSSSLEQDLANKTPGLRSYLELLGMDLSYMFHHTYYTPYDPETFGDESNYRPPDTDILVEVDVPQEDGTTKTINWPAERVRPGIRARRFDSLIQSTALGGESEDTRAPLLAQAIARRIMFVDAPCAELTRETAMVLRFRRRLLQDLIAPNEDDRDDATLDPHDPSYLRTIYELRAFINDDNQVEIAQVKAASNTAAPESSSSPPAAAPGTTGGGTQP